MSSPGLSEDIPASQMKNSENSKKMSFQQIRVMKNREGILASRNE